MAYVAAEVRDPKRNIIRALAFGTLGVTVVYLIVNGAFLHALGFLGVAGSDAVASDAVASTFSGTGAGLVSALICISALGAVSGMVFTGARISYAVGADHPTLRWIGRWTATTGTPVPALLLQAGISVGLIFFLGSFVETILYTSAAVYTFYLATSVGLLVLRRKESRVERPYRVTGYPVTTLLFCGACLFLIQGAIRYRPHLASIPFALIPPGLFLYWLSRRRLRRGLPGGGPGS
jgi:amino acid transporter